MKDFTVLKGNRYYIKNIEPGRKGISISKPTFRESTSSAIKRATPVVKRGYVALDKGASSVSRSAARGADYIVNSTLKSSGEIIRRPMFDFSRRDMNPNLEDPIVYKYRNK